MRAEAGGGRWWIAVAGTLLQVCLGTVYAWSYFQNPVVRAFDCTQSQAAWAFSLAIGFLGLAAAWGGLKLPVCGPRRLAMTGGACYAAGYLVSALAVSRQSLPLFYAGFGVLGGIGLGLGYVTPVATVARWFPDRKGLVTGMVVMGFGFGALLMSKVVAPMLMAWFDLRLAPVFAGIGLILFLLTLPLGWCLRNPPTALAALAASASETNGISGAAGSLPVLAARVRSWEFARLWVVFFCNITAGIMFIGFQSPMIQELWRRQRPDLTAAELATAGATLIGVSSVFNGLGRLLWGACSDRLGRWTAFRWILGSQLVVLVSLVWVKHPWLFGGCVCYVLLCYGGGFGTMPSLVLDTFGSGRMAQAYGAMLTAWSMAGVVGPQIVAMIKDRWPGQASHDTFATAAAMLAIGLLATWRRDRSRLAVHSLGRSST
jgi:MFS transporter, OFA family, oxalate/formate antiporter